MKRFVWVTLPLIAACVNGSPVEPESVERPVRWQCVVELQLGGDVAVECRRVYRWPFEAP